MLQIHNCIMKLYSIPCEEKLNTPVPSRNSAFCRKDSVTIYKGLKSRILCLLIISLPLRIKAWGFPKTRKETKPAKKVQRRRCQYMSWKQSFYIHREEYRL